MNTEPGENRHRWQAIFEAEWMERGGTYEARAEMVAQTPEWLCQILSFEYVFGPKPLWCTCAKWYMDGTHHAECLHVIKGGDPGVSAKKKEYKQDSFFD